MSHDTEPNGGKKNRTQYASPLRLARLVEAAKSAGVHVLEITAKPDGTIRIVGDGGKLSEDKQEDDPDEALRAWEVQHGLARGS